MAKRLAIAVLAVVLGFASAAQADPFTFDLVFDAGLGGSGSGTLVANDLGAGRFGVTDGTLRVVGGAAAGDYTLYPNPTPWAAFISPSGSFQTNNVLYFPSNPVFDVYGILFVQNGGTGREVNLWGNSASNYSFYSSPSTYYWDVAIDGFQSVTITPVPEPASSLLLMGMGLAGLLWKRKSL